MIGKIVPEAWRKFRLRTTLVAPFVLQIVAAVGLVGYLSFRNGQQAVQELVSQLQQEVSSRVSERVRAYIEVPHLVNKINKDVARLGEIQFDDLANSKDYLRNYFWKQVLRFEQIGYIGLANEKGQYLRVGWSNRGVGSGPPQVAQQLKMGVGELFFINLDGNGQPIGLDKARPNYDVRQRPFYTVVKGSLKPAWSEPYINFGHGSLQINASLPFYDEQGNFMGIFTSQLGLEQIRGFLQSLKVGKSGQVFIIEPSGELIATSLTSQPITVIKGKDEIRVAAQESNNPIMRQSMAYLKENLGNLTTLQASTQLNFAIDGKGHFLRVSPLRDAYGLNWLVVVVVPEADFMERINTNTRNTVLLCLMALGLAIAIGIHTSRWVTGPILRVSQASNELAKGNLDQHIVSSPIIEIDTLANSFNGMAKQLKDSFDTLETKNEELLIAEENYRSIFENALEGIFQSSPQGKYINVNPALARIYGYDSPREMIESITNIGEQIYVDPERRVEFRELLDKQGTVKNFEYRCYCKDGSIIWTEIDARMVKDSNGKLLYYEGLVHDITERKRREEELRRQLEELKIEIDHQKREKEVAMLTESSYFQEVKQEMAQVNLDEFWR